MARSRYSIRLTWILFVWLFAVPLASAQRVVPIQGEPRDTTPEVLRLVETPSQSPDSVLAQQLVEPLNFEQRQTVPVNPFGQQGTQRHARVSPPQAIPDVYTTPEGVPLVVSAPGHLANDFDPDGDPVEWISYTFPSGGTMTGTTSEGAFTYTPNPGFAGLETIQVAITDGNGGIDIGLITILVVADQNRAPVAVPDVFTTPEGTPLTVSPPGHLANDFDLDGDPVEWISYTFPSGGTMTGTTSEGAFVYTPNPGFSGLDEITYTITDGKGGIASSKLLIRVVDDQNRPPVAVADVYTTPQGAPLTITAPGHLANDFDPDGNPVEWISYTFPSGGTMTGTTSEGAFVYTPNPGFSGLDEITYTITDGKGGIASSKLLIRVLPIITGTAPIAVPDVFTTPEGVPLVVSAPGHLANDFDPNGDPVEWISYTFPSGGTMTGTTSEGAFVYTPNPGFSGLDEITYTITDGKGGIASSKLLILVIDDQNRPPVAIPDVFTTPEGTPLTVTPPGHLANDFDLDGDPVEWISYTFPSGGTMTGTTSEGAFVYTPNPGFSGLDEITYTITDGKGGIASSKLFIRVVDDQNRPPVAVPDVFLTPVGTPLVVTAPGHLANDYDLDGDPIEWISYTFPSNGTVTGTVSDGAFVYTPDPGFSGIETFIVTITDGNGGIASGLIAIHVGPLPPTPTVACTPAAPLLFSDWDLDPADGPSDPRGEYAELTNDSGDGTTVSLSACDFLVFDPFTETVTYATNATGAVADATTYSFASTLPTSFNGQTLPPAILPDGPSAFALINGTANVGDDVLTVLANADIVAAVVVAEDGSEYASVRGGMGTSTNQAFLDAMSRIFSVSNETVEPEDLSLDVHPNPIAHTGQVRYTLQRTGTASVALYDVLGREVKVLAQGPHASGPHTAALPVDGLESGVYVVRLVTQSGTRSVALTVTR